MNLEITDINAITVSKGNREIHITTEHGDIVIELFPARYGSIVFRMPGSFRNFLDKLKKKKARIARIASKGTPLTRIEKAHIAELNNYFNELEVTND